MKVWVVVDSYDSDEWIYSSEISARNCVASKIREYRRNGYPAEIGISGRSWIVDQCGEDSYITLDPKDVED